LYRNEKQYSKMEGKPIHLCLNGRKTVKREKNLNFEKMPIFKKNVKKR